MRSPGSRASGWRAGSSWQPDPIIQKIVAGWPASFDARRGRQMGFEADADVGEIIQAHIEDELGGNIA